MKFNKQRFQKLGGYSVNYRTGQKTIVADEIGYKIKVSAKCPECDKKRTATIKLTGYTNNGFNKMSHTEMYEEYNKKADEKIKDLESGVDTLRCSKCKTTLV